MEKIESLSDSYDEDEQEAVSYNVGVMTTNLCKKCGEQLPKRSAVCPHCGAGRVLSLVYFVVACILIVGIVGAIGASITLWYLNPVIEQNEKEIRQPLPPYRR